MSKHALRRRQRRSAPIKISLLRGSALVVDLVSLSGALRFLMKVKACPMPDGGTLNVQQIAEAI